MINNEKAVEIDRKAAPCHHAVGVEIESLLTALAKNVMGRGEVFPLLLKPLHLKDLYVYTDQKKHEHDFASVSNLELMLNKLIDRKILNLSDVSVQTTRADSIRPDINANYYLLSISDKVSVQTTGD